MHSRLIFLDLSYNIIKHITSGTFDPLINLEQLMLFRNMISNMDNALIVNMNKRTSFNIGNNELTRLPTKWLPTKLQQLYISGNAIKYLSVNTFEGAFDLYRIELPLNNINIGYNTFSKLTKLRYIEYPRTIHTCTCTYVWYLDTGSDSTVCHNINTNYTSIRDYLKEECKDHIPGIHIHTHTHIYI